MPTWPPKEPPGQPLHSDQQAGLGLIQDPSWGEAQRRPRAPGTGTQKAVWALGSEWRDLGPIRGPCSGSKLASGGQSCRGLPPPADSWVKLSSESRERGETSENTGAAESPSAHGKRQMQGCKVPTSFMHLLWAQDFGGGRAGLGLPGMRLAWPATRPRDACVQPGLRPPATHPPAPEKPSWDAGVAK